MPPSPTSPHAADAPETEPGFASLSWPTFLVSLGIVLAIFLALNPLWEPIDMVAMDQNIWWSYVPIPFLVLAFLALERKLSLGAFLIETMRLTFVKFVLTFLAANILWALTDPPGLSEPPSTPGTTPGGAVHRAPHEAPVSSAIDPARTGAVSGIVVDAAGMPLTGALVWISDGLQPHTFAPPTGTITISNDGRGFTPDPVILGAFQPVSLRSGNGVLHTVSGTDETGRRVFNIPVSPALDRALQFDRGHGLMTLACEVHRDTEPFAHALVLDHPFATRTDRDGRFGFTGVPAGEVELSAWYPSGAVLADRALLVAGQATSIRLTLP